MRPPSARTWPGARQAIVTVVDEVFDAVRGLRDEALAAHRAAAGRLHSTDVARLADGIRPRLQEPGSLLTGLGLVMAPGVLVDEHLHLTWWQTERGRSGASPLRVDLNPTSTGYYDYVAAEWFDAPRRSGGAHVTGPYVDVHGTGECLLTFTLPVLAGEEFLGVTGADVPAVELERRLLDELPRDVEVVVVNAAGRVVLSSSPRLLVGELVPAAELSDASTEPLPHVPWQAVVPAPRPAD